MAAGKANSKKMKHKEYEKHLHKLQVELCRLQDWDKAEGARIIVVFEGRDAAGKGGTIKAVTERVSPRVFRVVALRTSISMSDFWKAHHVFDARAVVPAAVEDHDLTCRRKVRDVRLSATLWMPGSR